MAVIKIDPPFVKFTERNGNPLNDGFVYIGEENLDPINNPITVYEDAALTTPLSQPLRTNGGFIVSGNSPKNVYTAENKFSILVSDKNNSTVFSRTSSDDLEDSGINNIQKYGAKGDGVTNDAAAINNALQDAGEIFFPDGTYIVGGELTVLSNTHIKLSENAIIKAQSGFMTSGSGNSVFLFQSGASNIKISGGEINGNLSAADLVIWPNSAGNSTSPFGRPVNLVVMQNNSKVVIDGVKFKDCIATSIKEYGTFSGSTQGDDITIKNCFFDNVLGNCIDGEIEKLNVTQNRVNFIGDIRGTSGGGTKGGLVVVKTRDTIISNNNINQTTDSSIYVTGDGFGQVSITGNFVKYSGKDAIKLLESSCDGTITGNVVICSGGSPIGVFDDGVNDRGHSVISSNIIGYVVAPTDILDPLDGYATTKTITGCQNQSSLWGSSYDRAAIGAAASHLVITGNKITNSLGIAINPVENDIVISNNIIENSTGAGCFIQSQSCIVESNIFSNVGSDATKTVLGRIQGVAVSGDNEAITIHGNQIKTVGGEGIYSDSDTDKLIISENHIESFCQSSGDGGIYINGAISPGSVLDLVINGNIVVNDTTTKRSIYVRNADNLIISNNLLTGGLDGIYANNCGDSIVSSNRVRDVQADGVRVGNGGESAAIIGNTVDVAVRGIVSDSSVNLVTAYGNIGTNCSSSSYSLSAATTIKPGTVSDANI